MECNNKKVLCSSSSSSSLDPEVRKGPWTLEEDMILMNYIANYGEGVWNSLAKQAGLKRTGKSCRLRWLNYLRPDVRRGNITPEEQLLIMDLHSKWGNRWSKIAKHLPGRTDNEIKNFWRTRIQKHMKPVDTTFSGHSQSQSSGSSQMNDHTAVTSATGPTVQTHLLQQPYHHDHHHHNHMVPPLQAPNNIPADSNNENVYWNMEDFWSMQLLNGD